MIRAVFTTFLALAIVGSVFYVGMQFMQPFEKLPTGFQVQSQVNGTQANEMIETGTKSAHGIIDWIANFLKAIIEKFSLLEKLVK